MNNLPQHIQRSGEIGIAEEYPAEADEVERNDDAEEAADATTAFAFFRPVMPIQNLWTAKATPCNIPQNTKFQEAPCHKPPRNMVMIRLAYWRIFALTVARPGIYRDNRAANWKARYANDARTP